MSYFRNYFSCITGVLIFAFSPLYAFQSKDLLPEGSFTPGIEGPAVNKAGELYAVNFQKEGTIGKVDTNGKAEVYLSLPEGSIGNGIRFDIDQHMFIADYVNHRVYRVEKDTKIPVVWAEASAMNQPNDLAVSDAGFIYLSDPNWAENTGNIWMITPAGKVCLLASNMGTTNGIEVSSDGKFLYVNESVQRRVWKYDILEDGAIDNKRLFFSFEDFGLDGMRCDAKGNLYIARYDKGTVVMISPKGEQVKEITLKGKKPSNLAFGGVDGRDGYVTMADRGCIEVIRIPHPGSYYTKVH